MSNELDVDGYWWLPETPEHKVPGSLTFSIENGARLTLIGTMDDRSNARRREVRGRHGDYGRVHGESRAGIFTIEGCFQISRGMSLGGAPAQEIIAGNQVIQGAWFDADEEVLARSLLVQMDGLAPWIARSGLDYEMSLGQPPSDDRMFVVSGRELSARSIHLPDRTTIRLRHWVGLDGDDQARVVRQGFNVRLSRPGRVTLPDLIDVVSDLQDVLSVAIGRPAAFRSVTFTHPEVYRTRSRRRYHDDLSYFARWNARSEKSQVDSREMFFDLDDLGGTRGLRRVLIVAGRHREELGTTLGTRYAAAMYPSDRLLNRTAALEAFDRRLHPQRQTFQRRLRRLAELGGDAFVEMVGESTRWCAVMESQRDDVAHHLGRRRPTVQVHYLAETAYWLFVLCLLQEAKVPQRAIDRIRAHRTYRHVGERARDVVAALT